MTFGSDIFPASVKQSAAFTAVAEVVAQNSLKPGHHRRFNQRRSYDVIRQHTHGSLVIRLRYSLMTGDYLLTRTHQVTYRSAVERGRRYQSQSKAEAVLERYIQLLDYAADRSVAR